MTRRFMFCIVIASAAMLFSALALCQDTVTGKVARTGWGKIEITDSPGSTRVFSLSSKLTRYEPAGWKPMVGDQVKVTFTQVESRGRIVVRADLIVLVDAAKQPFQSPVEVQILENGRSALRVKIVKTNFEERFSKSRETEFSPAGWVPAPGEKASIEFVAKPGRFRSGVTYVAIKVTRI